MELYTTSNKKTLLKAALALAKNGKPVFPCKPGDKEPLVKDWPNQATTDPRKIHMFWKRWPNANIAVLMGRRSRVFALDDDQQGAIEALEAEHGPLPKTRTHATGSGGKHYLFEYPEGVEIRNSAGKLAEGLDVRGERGYILVPPSRTTGAYGVLDASSPAAAPDWLTEALTEPQEAASKVRSITTAASVSADGAAIPEGTRDVTLASIAGLLHDGSRTLENLTTELLEINARRCEPPLPDSQVVKIANSIHKREPCQPGRPREVDELVGVLSDYWHGQDWKGLARKSEARFARALIREGRRVGTVIPMGLRVEESYREMAEILGVHVNTVTNIVKRGKTAGWLRQDNAGRKGAQSGAFVLVNPRQLCDTLTHARPMGEGVTSLSRSTRKPLNVAHFTTSHHRHRGPVGYSKEHTLCILESHGPQDRETVAELLGWARPRDLERLHLEPLAALGLLEKHGDHYGVPGDYVERREKIRGEEYSTVQPRVLRERSIEGRFVHVVKESGMVASEAQRARLDEAKHKREREGYRDWLANRVDTVSAIAHNVGADGYIEDLEPVEIGDRSPLSPLAVAIRDYLDKHPHQARQPAGWIGSTLWAYEFYDGKPTPAQARDAIEELGGTAYLDQQLKRSKGAA